MRAFLAAFLVALACLPSTALCEDPPDPVSVGRLAADHWKHLIARQVARQAAGEKSPTRAQPTWEQYWTAWYSAIRRSPALPWKDSEFKTAEDMVGYIKQQLKTHSIPTYERT